MPGQPKCGRLELRRPARVGRVEPVRRSRAVDALRAVAVLLVLLHHLDIGPVVFGTPWLAWLRDLHAAGFVGVSLFLVLSGFSIHLRVAAGAQFRTRAFLWRRFLRLHPTYYAAMCFAAAVALVSAAAGHPWAHPRWGFADTPMPVPVLVAVHVTVLAGTLVPPGWLMVTWSLALEEQIYLVYAAAVRRMRRTSPVVWVLAGLALCLVWRVAAELLLPSTPKSFAPLAPQSSWVAALAFQQVPSRLAEWLLGALAAEWYAGNQRLPRVLTSRVTALAGLAGVWWLFGHRGGYGTLGGHPFAATDLVFDPATGLAFAVLLCGCLAAERRRAERHRGGSALVGRLAWLGERSYSLYLVQAPVLGTTFALCTGMIRPAAGRLAVAALAVALAVAAAALLYRFVEAPTTAWSKRAGRRRGDRPDQAPAQRSAVASSDQRYATASAPL